MSRAHWIELLLLTALASLVVGALPLSAQVWGWSWDALNHHVYLGLISEHQRWHLDATAASVQSWQYPYLYWPVYRLSLLPIEGTTAGAVWGVFLCLAMVPPVWLTCRHLLPKEESALQGIFERSAACALAFCSVVVISSMGTTANDPLATVPLLWALSLLTHPSGDNRMTTAAAALWGVGTAFKLSNALMMPMLLVWLWCPGGWQAMARRGCLMAAAAAGGFSLAYAPWGWQLWRETGNPIYPFLQNVFGG